MHLLFDIGGTKTRIAASDGSSVGDPVIFDTPASFEEGMRLVEQEGKKLAESYKGVVGGIAGPLNGEKTILVSAPHLPGWIGKPLAEELRNRFRVPVLLENDAALAGLGEAVYGAGKGKDIVAYLTVSTGVGGARIVRGRIDESARGFEPGHQIVEAGKELEEYVSGTAVEARYGRKPYEITEQAVWEELARMLALGLNNTIVHWSPDVLVLGGSMITGTPSIPLNVIRDELKEILRIFPDLPEIRTAELQSLGGLYGAMAKIREGGSSAPASQSSVAPL